MVVWIITSVGQNQWSSNYKFMMWSYFTSLVLCLNFCLMNSPAMLHSVRRWFFLILLGRHPTRNIFSWLRLITWCLFSSELLFFSSLLPRVAFVPSTKLHKCDPPTLLKSCFLFFMYLSQASVSSRFFFVPDFFRSCSRTYDLPDPSVRLTTRSAQDASSLDVQPPLHSPWVWLFVTHCASLLFPKRVG